MAMTEEEARRIIKLSACTKCSLEASSHLHRFCQNFGCPILEAIEVLRAALRSAGGSE